MAQKTPLSRRSFLKASGASLTVTTAVTVSTALANAVEPDPDAELMALVDEWKEARAHYDQVRKTYDRAETRYYATRPNFPDVCNRQPGDPALNLCASYHVGKPYDCADIERLRVHDRKRAFYELLTDEERAKRGLPTDALEIQRLEPWPEAQARADEILSAWDKYEAGLARASEETGVDAAEEAHSEALEAADAIVADIARTRAHTLKGMLIMARLADLDPANKSGLEHDLEDAIESKSNAPELLGLSLVIDILRMNGGQT